MPHVIVYFAGCCVPTAPRLLCTPSCCGHHYERKTEAARTCICGFSLNTSLYIALGCHKPYRSGEFVGTCTKGKGEHLVGGMVKKLVGTCRCSRACRCMGALESDILLLFFCLISSCNLADLSSKHFWVFRLCWGVSALFLYLYS